MSCRKISIRVGIILVTLLGSCERRVSSPDKVADAKKEDNSGATIKQVVSKQPAKLAAAKWEGNWDGFNASHATIGFKGIKGTLELWYQRPKGENSVPTLTGAFWVTPVPTEGGRKALNTLGRASQYAASGARNPLPWLQISGEEASGTYKGLLWGSLTYKLRRDPHDPDVLFLTVFAGDKIYGGWDNQKMIRRK